ncbi:MAG TPA: carbohydrate ABC transporter permease [Candidatus Limnocylindrales bacterium]|nr:carbohydrate ABC transporter permease [Candidatus Limnocylindrales bacterium]
MTSTAAPAMAYAEGESAAGRVRSGRPQRNGLVHVFLIVMAALWLFPLAWAVYQSFRTYGDTAANPVGLPQELTVQNYIDAWNQAELPHFYLNTLLVTIPAVIVVLFVASMVAFALTKFNFRFNLWLLMLFTAGNLLPPQVIIVPLFRIYLTIRGIPEPLSDNGLLYDQYIGIILIHIVFQMGFCIFVLGNYMRTLSRELVEAAQVDGAGIWTVYSRVILPLCRPALAALATLEFTFIYNDFFWALLLMSHGDRRPITSALNNLTGLFFSNTNLLAAGSILVAIPTIVVFIALQKQFVRGLALGSTKG